MSEKHNNGNLKLLDKCRICLIIDTDLLKTSSLLMTTTYNQELSFCVPEINWTCSDVPSVICYKCRRNLETAANFRRQCLESHKTRQDFLENFHKFADSHAVLNIKHQLILNNDSNVTPEANEIIEAVDDPHLSDTESESIRDLKQPENLPVTRIKSSESSVKTKLLLDKNQTEIENVENDKFYVPNRKERICIFCNCKFSKYSSLKNHVRSIHTLEKCFKCNLCGEGFTNTEILTRHKNRHTGDRKYVCSYCGKKFFTNSDLNHHVQRHQNERNYKCDTCENKSFNTANSLRAHRLVVHTNSNEWKYLCTTCGRKCVTQTALTVHMKRHFNEKNFSCHLCTKNFCTKSERSKHIASHSNMRLYKCEVCSQEYKDRRVMEKHLTRKHGIGNAKIVERVKKFACDVCPKKFIGKRQLEKHLRAHNGEKPFKCEICEQAFICSSYIKGHMLNKHFVDIQGK